MATRELRWFTTAPTAGRERGRISDISEPSPAVRTRECKQFTVKMPAYPGVLQGQIVISTQMSLAKLQESLKVLKIRSSGTRSDPGSPNCRMPSPTVKSRECKKFAVPKHAWAGVPYIATENFTNLSLAWQQESSVGLRQPRSGPGNAVF